MLADVCVCVCVCACVCACVCMFVYMNPEKVPVGCRCLRACV